jgi:DNA-binding MarR family transcriptional regulator
MLSSDSRSPSERQPAGRPSVPRQDVLELVAATLISRTSRLSRLLMSRGSRQLSRTEAGVLSTLLDGPRRITDLAETEGLAQPSVSKLVDKLEGRALVVRSRAADDGRAVLVSISGDGRRTLQSAREEIRSQLRQTLGALADDDLAALARATDVVEQLVRSLQTGDGRA